MLKGIQNQSNFLNRPPSLSGRDYPKHILIYCIYKEISLSSIFRSSYIDPVQPKGLLWWYTNDLKR